MPQKKSKKSQSTWQWYKSLSGKYKTILFVLIFAVLGGGLAVYRSFAFAWTHIINDEFITVSACREKTIVIGHGEPNYYETRWAIRSGQPIDYFWYVEGPNGRKTETRFIPKGGTDWFRTTITAPSGTYKAWAFTDSKGGVNEMPNVNPANIVSCSGTGK